MGHIGGWRYRDLTGAKPRMNPGRLAMTIARKASAPGRSTGFHCSASALPISGGKGTWTGRFESVTAPTPVDAFRLVPRP